MLLHYRYYEMSLASFFSSPATDWLEVDNRNCQHNDIGRGQVLYQQLKTIVADVQC
jgi:hypothetical protein